MMKEKNSDDLFREKLKNYEQAPPAYLLERILDGVEQGRRKRRLVWWRISGVAAALLLAFVAGWQLNNSEVRHNEKTASIKIDNQKPKTENTEIKTTNDASQNPIASLAATTTHAKGEQHASKSNASEFILAPVNKEPGAAERTDDDFSVLKTLKGFLTKREKGDVFQEKKLLGQVNRLNEKTIDQQIMEMNQQMMAAADNKKDKASWSFGAQISPEINGYQSSHTQAYASNMLKTKANSVDLAGGVSVEYKKGKRWSLQSGIYYSGMGQSSGNQSNPPVSYASPSPPNENYFNNAVVKVDAVAHRYTLNSVAGEVELTRIPDGMVLGASLDDRSALSNAVVVSQNTFIQDFDYLEVPLYLRYNLVNRKFGVDMIGGISSNILVGNRLYVDGASGKTLVGQTKDLEPFNYSGTVGLGFKYGLSNRISLNVEPRFKYFLSSLSSNPSITYKPYTFGVYTGLSYNF